MTKKTRKLLLAFIIAFFVIFTPIILLYACGYSFDFAAKKIIKTGGFNINSLPDKAEIFLNNKTTGKTPKYIKRLIPKQYQVKVQKQGYLTWEKKLNIKPQLVTEATNILLLKKNPKIELVAEGVSSIEEALKIKPSPKDYFSPKQKEELAGYKVIDQNIYYIKKADYLLYKNNLEGLNSQKISIESLPLEKDYKIFIANHQIAVLSNDHQLFLFKENKKTFELIASDIIGVQFASDDKKLLYFSQNEIWVRYLDKIQTQPYHEKGETELITRLSKPIKKALWYTRTNEHIIFSVNGMIKVAELDGRDKRNIYDFVKADPDQLYYEPKDKKLYYLENQKLYFVLLEKPNGLF